ncbi:MAG: GAF domain-containing protein [Gemmatimonadetes bacterium]|nr:MAG: GAF domain-containing protein [Gemmatimonadota bacterium]
MFQFFKNLKLRTKLVLAFTLIVTLPVAILTYRAMTSVTGEIEESLENRLQESLAVAEEIHNDFANQARDLAIRVSQLPSLQNALLEMDENPIKQYELLQFVNIRREQSRLDFITAVTFEVADIHGNIVAKSYQAIPDHRQFLTKPQDPKIMEALRFAETSSVRSTKHGIIVKGFAPVRTHADPFGVVIVGFRIDDGLAQKIARITGNNVNIYLGDQLVGSTFPEESRQEWLNVHRALLPFLDKLTSRVEEIGEEPYKFGYFKFKTYTGETESTPGLISISIPYSQVVKLKRQSTVSVTQSALVALILAVIFGYILSNAITTPVLKLVDMANAVSKGDFSQRVAVESEDEIGVLGSAFNHMTDELEELITSLERLNQVGIALSREHDLDVLLDRILEEARALTKAEAANLFIVREDGLHFRLSQNPQLLVRGEAFEEQIIPLDEKTIAGYVATTGETLNLADVYHLPADSPYQFNTQLDQNTGYKTTSMLALPMVDREGVMGVLQLMNASDGKGNTIGFDEDSRSIATSLASQAAVAIQNADLLQELKAMLNSIVHFSAYLIDARDKSTSGHSQRVHDYTMAIAHAINQVDEGPYAEISFTAQELEELSVAAYLHDIGKVSVPEYIMGKANKLLDEQLDAIKSRFQYVEKYYEANLWKQLAQTDDDAEKEKLHAQYEAQVKELRDNLQYVFDCNVPGVWGYMSDEKIEKLKEIAAKTYEDTEGNHLPFLTDIEVKNLSIRRGSLTDEERRLMKSHVVHSIRILDAIPFPKHMKDVPYIAGAHHEALNGTGYPRGWTAEKLNPQCRIMMVADIFDALTSKRVYKPGMPIEKAFRILEEEEVGGGRMDGELVKIFKSRELYKGIIDKEGSDFITDKADNMEEFNI